MSDASVRRMMVLLFLDLSWGQSYIYGRAMYRDRVYAINIQYGRKALMLPRELVSLYPDAKSVIVHLYTDSGKRVTAEYSAEVSRSDMIEVYDEDVTNAIAKELPVEMLIEFL
ncbi:MAG: hypothetical protein RMJ59_07730 [Candidatus Nitrosocaldus sp.]|nr:hypothetical protein [Candidatus Nitrosocaldus sp.]MDW8276249.1 hypothetical protein [Candidatus Nitrosocaldus sp.]